MLGVTAGCNGIGGGDNLTRTVDPALAGTPTPAAAWDRRLESLFRVDVVDGRLLAQQVAADTVRITALDPTDGRTVWEASMPSRSLFEQIGNRLLASALGTEPVVRVFEPATGELLWERPGRAGLRSIREDTVVIGRFDTDFQILAVDPRTNEERWNTTVQSAFGAFDDRYLALGSQERLVARDLRDGTVRWKWETDVDLADTAVTAADGVAVFAGDGGQLRGVRLPDGRVTFRGDVGRSTSRFGLVGPENGVFYGDQPPAEPGPPARVVRVVPTEGIDWSVTLDAPAVYPYSVGDQLSGAVAGQGIAAVADGDVLWRRAEPAVAYDDRGSYTVADDELRAIDQAGGVRWRVELGSTPTPAMTRPESDPPDTVIVARDNAVVVAGDRGVASYDPADGSVRTATDEVSGSPESIAFANGRFVYGTRERLVAIPV